MANIRPLRPVFTLSPVSWNNEKKVIFEDLGKRWTDDVIKAVVFSIHY